MHSSIPTQDSSTTLILESFRRLYFGSANQRSRAIFVLMFILVVFIRPQFELKFLETVKFPFIIGLLSASAWLACAKLRWDPILSLLTGFVIYGALWVPFAVNNSFAFAGFRDFLQTATMLVFPVAVTLSFGMGLRRLLKTLMIVSVFLALYAVTHGGRGPGDFLGDENDLAMVLVMLIPLCLYPAFGPLKGLPTLIQVAIATLLAGGVLVTSSRGGFMGLAIAAIGLFLRMKRKSVFIFLVVAAIPIVVLFAPANYTQRLSTITKTGEGTARERLDSWGIAWHVFTQPQNTVFGIGMKNMRLHMGDKLTSSGRNLWGREVHSLYFQILPELGLVGAAMFGAVLYYCIGGNRRVYVRLTRKLSELSRERRSYAHFVQENGLEAALSDSSSEVAKKMESLKKVEQEVDFCIACARATNVSWIGLLVSAAFISVFYYPPIWLLAGFSSALQGYGKSLAQLVDRVLPAKGIVGTEERYGSPI